MANMQSRVSKHCAVCLDEPGSGAHNLTTLVCKHHICEGCIIIMFTSAADSERYYPPKCCDTISLGPAVTKVLGKELTERYRHAIALYAIPAEARVYCSSPTCSKQIHPERFDSKGIASCMECSNFTCCKCRHAVDSKSTNHNCTGPIEEDVEAAKAAKAAGAKPCPSCRIYIQLADACNHVQCDWCQHQFCFVCLRNWTSVREGREDEHNCPMYHQPPPDPEGYIAGFHQDTGLDREGYNADGWNLKGVNRAGRRRHKPNLENGDSEEAWRFLRRDRHAGGSFAADWMQVLDRHELEEARIALMIQETAARPPQTPAVNMPPAPNMAQPGFSTAHGATWLGGMDVADQALELALARAYDSGDDNFDSGDEDFNPDEARYAEESDDGERESELEEDGHDDGHIDVGNRDPIAQNTAFWRQVPDPWDESVGELDALRPHNAGDSWLVEAGHVFRTPERDNGQHSGLDVPRVDNRSGDTSTEARMEQFEADNHRAVLAAQPTRRLALDRAARTQRTSSGISQSRADLNAHRNSSSSIPDLIDTDEPETGRYYAQLEEPPNMRQPNGRLRPDIADFYPLGHAPRNGAPPYLSNSETPNTQPHNPRRRVHREGASPARPDARSNKPLHDHDPLEHDMDGFYDELRDDELRISRAPSLFRGLSRANSAAWDRAGPVSPNAIGTQREELNAFSWDETMSLAETGLARAGTHATDTRDVPPQGLGIWDSAHAPSRASAAPAGAGTADAQRYHLQDRNERLLMSSGVQNPPRAPFRDGR